MLDEQTGPNSGATGEGRAGTTSGREVTSIQVPILEYPSPNQEDIRRQQCLIVFIPGNPGLIGGT